MCPSMVPQPGVLCLFPSQKVYSEAMTCSPPLAAAMPTRLPAFTASPPSLLQDQLSDKNSEDQLTNVGRQDPVKREGSFYTFSSFE